jgi:hypothetical protein
MMVREICGVGKFLVRWKEKETPTCPRCGQYEDARHVWLFNHTDAQNLWKTELDKLLVWLVQIDTDPDITEGLIGSLRQCFLLQNDQINVISTDVRIGLQHQQVIVGKLLGRLHHSRLTEATTEMKCCNA